MKYLKELRKAAGFNQQEIADALRISRSHYAGIEQGTYIHGKTDDEYEARVLTFLRFECIRTIRQYMSHEDRVKDTANAVQRLIDLERTDLPNLLQERVIILPLDHDTNALIPSIIPQTFEALSALRLYQTLIGRIDVIILNDYCDNEKLLNAYINVEGW